MTEQEQTSVHVPFGAGRDRPGITFRANSRQDLPAERAAEAAVESLFNQITAAFGLPVDGPPRSLAELIVEAGTWATTLGDAAAEIGYRPSPDSMTTDQFRANIQAGSIAQRAREDRTPDDSADIGDPLGYAIAESENRDQIVKIRKDNRPDWTPRHDELAKARLAELEGTA